MGVWILDTGIKNPVAFLKTKYMSRVISDHTKNDGGGVDSTTSVIRLEISP